MCTVLCPIYLFCVSQNYFLPRSDFLRIFLLLKILSFCFSSECLPPSHHQMNLALDNSKYLLFSSPSHTCPHSTFLLIPSAFPLSFPARRPPLLIVRNPGFFPLMSYVEDSNPSAGISVPHDPYWILSISAPCPMKQGIVVDTRN